MHNFHVQAPGLRDPDELPDLSTALTGSGTGIFRIALLIPMCGSAGLWAPSCISSAQVAIDELNRADGIDGRQVELLLIDSALEAETPVDDVIDSLISVGTINAIVGMHLSAVRQKLNKIVRQRVPYIYTPLYEGGETTPGVFAIGDNPQTQLLPALDWFEKHRKIRKWALLGNDYIWPRVSNRLARRRLRELSAAVCYEQYLPFGMSDMSRIIDELSRSPATAILLTLIGQDAVNFNRAFGEAGLHKQMLRFSCAIEENGLMASGADNLHDLYTASSYLGSLDTESNGRFRADYHRLHGDEAPALNTLGQSTYEGIQFLAGLLETESAGYWRSLSHAGAGHINYCSARRDVSRRGDSSANPMYMAKTDGVMFEVLEQFDTSR